MLVSLKLPRLVVALQSWKINVYLLFHSVHTGSKLSGWG